MRLVNADKLPWVDKVILVDQVDGDVVIKVAPNYTSYVNKETPTVEAIPIEWIKQQANKYVEEDENGDDIWKEHLEWLIKEWEKENEISRHK